MALWILAAVASAQETEKDMVPEDLHSILEELEKSPDSPKQTLLRVDPQGRMKTVLLRYEALKKQMEAVPERNGRRFEIELQAVLEKAPPRVAAVTVDGVEIIDLRNRTVDKVRKAEDQLAVDVSDSQSKRRSPSKEVIAPMNPESVKDLSENRLEEISGTLKEIAEELFILANDESEVDGDAPTSIGIGQGH